MGDLAVFLVLPAATAAAPVLLGAPARHIPELLSATAIFTGLIFGVFVLMFDMTMRATDHSDPARRGPILQLASELRANISFAVLLGILLTGLLGGFVMFSDAEELPIAVTAAVVFGYVQMLLTIFMVLKRVRALYHAYPAAQPDRIP
ncbi:MAG TPA: hypothetical protein VGO94_09170 [Mycobacteriales bacterium]|nr:hypothetical protein [Mycobacteriales bacterium]